MPVVECRCGLVISGKLVNTPVRCIRCGSTIMERFGDLPRSIVVRPSANAQLAFMPKLLIRAGLGTKE